MSKGVIFADVNIAPLLAKLNKASQLTSMDTHAMIQREATLFVYNPNPSVPGIANITPPLGGSTRGKAGLAAGEASIDRDLFGIFSPRDLKGSRSIDHLFGLKDPDVGRKPPYVVPTREKHPNLKVIYNYRNARRKDGRALSRGQKQAFYVDRGKFEALRAELKSRVGWSCAAWYVAAIKAGLNPRGVPAWIKRHTNAPGAADIVTTATSFAIILTSATEWNNSLRMDEKAARVLGYRMRAIESQLPHLVRAAIKRAGLIAA